MNFFWSTTYERKCPDGNTRIIHKKIDTAFPLFIKGNNSKTSVDLDALKKVKGKLSHEHQSKLDGTLFELNEMNNTLMMKFRSAYSLFQANPCGGYDRFANEILKINNEHHRLSLIKTKMKMVVDMANSISPELMFKQIISILDEAFVVETATIEIEANRNLMKNIKDQNHGG